MKDRLDQVASREEALLQLAPVEVRTLADPLEVYATLELDGRLHSGMLGRIRVERLRPLEEGEAVCLVGIELRARDLVADALNVPASERFLVDEGLAPFRQRRYLVKGDHPFPLAWRRLLKNLREGVERIPTYGGPDAAERIEASMRTVELVLSGPEKVLQLVLPKEQVHDALARYLRFD